jgi:hypothetical protein
MMNSADKEGLGTEPKAANLMIAALQAYWVTRW